MGYYTNYSLSVINDRGSDLAILISEINSKYKCEMIDSDGYASCVKWYDWEDDMTKLSTKYPDFLIEITGDGEDSDDFWEARFKGGFEEYHRMYMPSFTNLVDTSKKSYKYLQDHTPQVKECREFDSLVEAITAEVPELMFNCIHKKELKKKLQATVLTFISENANKVIL